MVYPLLRLRSGLLQGEALVDLAVRRHVMVPIGHHLWAFHSDLQSSAYEMISVPAMDDMSTGGNIFYEFFLLA